MSKLPETANLPASEILGISINGYLIDLCITRIISTKPLFYTTEKSCNMCLEMCQKFRGSVLNLKSLFTKSDPSSFIVLMLLMEIQYYYASSF